MLNEKTDDIDFRRLVDKIYGDNATKKEVEKLK